MLSDMDRGNLIGRRRGGGASIVDPGTYEQHLGHGQGHGHGFGIGSVTEPGQLPSLAEFPGLDNSLSSGSGHDPDRDRARDEAHQYQLRLMVLRDRLRQAMFN